MKECSGRGLEHGSIGALCRGKRGQGETVSVLGEASRKEKRRCQRPPAWALGACSRAVCPLPGWVAPQPVEEIPGKSPGTAASGWYFSALRADLCSGTRDDACVTLSSAGLPRGTFQPWPHGGPVAPGACRGQRRKSSCVTTFSSSQSVCPSSAFVTKGSFSVWPLLATCLPAFLSPSETAIFTKEHISSNKYAFGTGACLPQVTGSIPGCGVHRPSLLSFIPALCLGS